MQKSGAGSGRESSAGASQPSPAQQTNAVEGQGTSRRGTVTMEQLVGAVETAISKTGAWATACRDAEGLVVASPFGRLSTGPRAQVLGHDDGTHAPDVSEVPRNAPLVSVTPLRRLTGAAVRHTAASTASRRASGAAESASSAGSQRHDGGQRGSGSPGASSQDPAERILSALLEPLRTPQHREVTGRPVLAPKSPSRRDFCAFLTIPVDVALLIMSMLVAEDLAVVAQTCRAFSARHGSFAQLPGFGVQRPRLLSPSLHLPTPPPPAVAVPISLIEAAVLSAARIRFDLGADEVPAPKPGEGPARVLFFMERLAEQGYLPRRAWVEAAGDHTRFLSSTGKIMVCGRAAEGQLGEQSADNLTQPRPMNGLRGRTALATGSSFFDTNVLTLEGEVINCGNSAHGKLGRTAQHHKLPKRCWEPRVVRPLAERVRVVAIASGGMHTLFLGCDGDVWSCGRGSEGQLGHLHSKPHHGNPIGSALGRPQGFGPPPTLGVPVRIEHLWLRGIRVESIAAGWCHSAVITRPFIRPCGRVWRSMMCFGQGTYGQLGLGDTAHRMLPEVVPMMERKDPISMALGDGTTLVATQDGGVFTWGNGEFGGLGHSGTFDQLIPKRVSALQFVDAVSVAAGALDSAAISRDGHLYTFGHGGGGRLGHGDQASQALPTRVEALVGHHVVHVSMGAAHKVVLTATGSVFAIGRGDCGQLGELVSGSAWTPMLIGQLIAPDVGCAVDVPSSSTPKRRRLSCRAADTPGPVPPGVGVSPLRRRPAIDPAAPLLDFSPSCGFRGRFDLRQPTGIEPSPAPAQDVRSYYASFYAQFATDADQADGVLALVRGDEDDEEETTNAVTRRLAFVEDVAHFDIEPGDGAGASGGAGAGAGASASGAGVDEGSRDRGVAVRASKRRRSASDDSDGDA